MSREEHDLAAKAAGYVLTWKEGSCKGGAYEAPFIERNGELVPWRPKEDDGDALRLAVRCGLLDEHAGFAYALANEMRKNIDTDVATRLAIFRTAIEVGKAMG